MIFLFYLGDNQRWQTWYQNNLKVKVKTKKNFFTQKLLHVQLMQLVWNKEKKFWLHKSWTWHWHNENNAEEVNFWEFHFLLSKLFLQSLNIYHKKVIVIIQKSWSYYVVPMGLRTDCISRLFSKCTLCYCYTFKI